MSLKRIYYLVFLGQRYDVLFKIDQFLPDILAYHNSTLCFEYPQFINLIDIITQKKKLIYIKSNNLVVFHSIGILPFGRYFILINLFNHLLNFLILSLFINIRSLNMKIITLTPEVIFLNFFHLLSKYNIYYYVAEYYTRLPQWNKYLEKIQFDILEHILLKTCKKVITNSTILKRMYDKKHNNVILFQQPGNVATYVISKHLAKIPIDIKSIRKPIIGFMGAFYDWRIDLKLIYQLLIKFPNASFVIIGEMKIPPFWEKKLFKNGNFYYLGYKSNQNLPNYVSNFDVCTIPYRLPLTAFAFPTKVYEYLSLGKPVVSTRLLTIKHLARRNLIYWSKTNLEFITNIRRALNENCNKELIDLRIKEALKNSWDNRIKYFIDIMEDN